MRSVHPGEVRPPAADGNVQNSWKEVYYKKKVIKQINVLWQLEKRNLDPRLVSP